MRGDDHANFPYHHELDRAGHPQYQGGGAAAARETAKKLGIEIKETYVTTGQSDLLAIVESPSGDNVAKFCMAIGSQGNVRTRTVRAWSQAEYAKLISELP
ncbi:MAG: GYD domain-containing protein [Xanthobacteraceae bacterium]